jgi:RimJ/RimL family protein N-acetyltransferase
VGVLARISPRPWLSGEVGVGVARRARGRGIGRDLLRTTFEDGFTAGLVRIEALVHPGNAACNCMVAAAGMRNEGLSESVLELDGVRVDAARWAIIAQTGLDRGKSA